jgi:hypothetical protein
MQLTDELIQGAIDSITGFIASRTAERLHRPVEEMLMQFLASKTYALLSDKNTGLYWDSLPEIMEMFLTELGVKPDVSPTPAD